MATIDGRASLASLADHRTRLRLERAGRHLHGMGPRVLSELLLELAERTGDPQMVLDAVAAYGRLTPAMLAAAGGDRFPVRPLRQVQP